MLLGLVLFIAFVVGCCAVFIVAICVGLIAVFLLVGCSWWWC